MAAPSEAEVIVLAEDITENALLAAECYPINRRFAGFFDYKRIRWLASTYGVFPQVLLVDAKASKENFRTTLQHSQLNIDADFQSQGAPFHMNRWIGPDIEIGADELIALALAGRLESLCGFRRRPLPRSTPEEIDRDY